MIRKIFPFVAIFIFLGCGKGHEEEQIKLREELTGTWCADMSSSLYKLELKADSSFSNQKVSRSAFTGRPITEKCVGKWDIVYDEGAKSWKLNMTGDEEESTALVSCSKEQTVKSETDTTLVIKDIFDDVQLSKEVCADL